MGSILAKTSVMRISIPFDLSSRSFLPLPRFILSRCPTTLLPPPLVFCPLYSGKVSHCMVYYESRNRDKRQDLCVCVTMYECRCDERLNTKSEKCTRLTYTGLLGELEHLKIETRLIEEMFASVRGEYVFLK